LGLTLVDVSTEQSVGGYRCDIVCRDEITKKTVIIENRLDGKKASRIVVDAAEFDFSDKKNYKKIMDDLIDMIVKFQKAFKPFLND
jgi:hypothetical protein